MLTQLTDDGVDDLLPLRPFTNRARPPMVFPDSKGGHMRGTNVWRRWWSQPVAATGLDADFKLQEMQQTAASLAIQVRANIKSLQNMLGHEIAALTSDRCTGPMFRSSGSR